ncbi:protein NKG7 [Rhynchocyon petersi]
MEPYLSLALLAASLGLVCNLVALSTSFWVVVVSDFGISIHQGLWFTGSVPEFIHVTQAFTIIASVLGLGSVVMLVWIYIPSLTAPDHSISSSGKTAFFAAMSMIIAMSVHTSKYLQVVLPHNLHLSFGWSFYLGWTSAIFLLCSATLSLFLHYGSARAGYDAL